MTSLVQRVNKASVTIDGKCVASINKGFLILLGVREGDTEKDMLLLAKKTANLRIFEDDKGRMNISPVQLTEKGEKCEIIVVSQFTLCAECKGQNRPSFISAAKPEEAERLYEAFVSELSSTYKIPTQKGVFGADMKVDLQNDGPVTIILESDKL